MKETGRDVTPGIYPDLVKRHFSREEWKIVENISRYWYVTSGGGRLRLGKTSEYTYFVVKPTDHYRQMFNLSRELIVIFSPYEQFESRTLDAIEEASKQYQSLRLDQIVSILISKDPEITIKLKKLLATEHETRVVIPFTYAELSGDFDEYLFSNRFREHFFSRDLFAYEAPLTKDLYFYGRSGLVQEIVNRYKSNENSGLFGLRKTGKTSVINAVRRVLEKENLPSAVIDCQDPSFHQRRWNKALRYVVTKIASDTRCIGLQLNPEESYTEENASLMFEDDIKKIKNKVKERILIIFDEIENITFGIAASENWRNKYDFVYFWQTIRTLFQKDRELFNFLIVGTNPRCVEEAKYNDIDNPIFLLIPFKYIPGFNYEQTKEMVEQLGGIMGLKFDESVLVRLTDDYAGHPFLIRHVCSVIHNNVRKTRPANVGRAIYEKAKETFNRSYGQHLDMILEILEKFYNDEYQMLKYLSINDYESFSEFAAISPTYTAHLEGYGLVTKEDDNYVLKIDALREHLSMVQTIQKMHPTKEQMLAEISSRRNRLEPNLRFMVRTFLAAKFGVTKARELVIKEIEGNKEYKPGSQSYSELFDPKLTVIYFGNLKNLIYDNWELFRDVFKIDKNDFKYRMDIINKYRNDAHAKTLDEKELTIWRACMVDIERPVNEYATIK